jgi:glycerate 2-kinase
MDVAAAAAPADETAMNILWAMDSWKGSLPAAQACAVAAAAWARAHPGDVSMSCPLADGGEGTAEALAGSASGEWRATRVAGPMPDTVVEARWYWMPGTRCAVMDMAEAAGLTLIPELSRDPLRATTRGVGDLIAAARAAGAREILLGLGGSATVDGGAGMAQALGWRLLDADGRDLPSGGGALIRLDRIKPSPARVAAGIRVCALCDVEHRLLGPRGAAAVFAPQKGAPPEAVAVLERGLGRLADVAERDLGLRLHDMPGGGAAGGLGAGVRAFLDGELRPGIDEVLHMVRFDDRLRGMDWVVTGEGRFDATSLRGKVVSGVLRTARAAGVRAAVLAGSVAMAEAEWRAAGIDAVRATQPDDMPVDEAMRCAPDLLAHAVEAWRLPA